MGRPDIEGWCITYFVSRAAEAVLIVFEGYTSHIDSWYTNTCCLDIETLAQVCCGESQETRLSVCAIKAFEK